MCNTPLIERAIDFTNPSRWLRCPGCSTQVRTSTAEYDAGTAIGCTNCQMTVETLHSRRLLSEDPADPARDVSQVVQFAWYHTTFCESWPPTEHEHALHLGTYESAIINMMRGMRDQRRAGEQFYLHRVRITEDIGQVAPDIIPDPGKDFSGDVAMSVVRGDGNYTVRRYVNQQEQVGAISLAVDASAIVETQHIDIPMPAISDGAVLAALRESIAVRDSIPAEPPLLQWRKYFEIARGATPGQRQRLDERQDLARAARAPANKAEDHYRRLRCRTYVPNLPEDVTDVVDDAARRFSADGNAFQADRRYRAMANMVTSPASVLRAMSGAPVVATRVQSEPSTPTIRAEM